MTPTPSTAPGTPPTAATNLTGQAIGNRQIVARWTIGAGATSQVLRVGTSSGNYNFTNITYPPSTNLGIINRTMPDVTYYFVVDSVNSHGSTRSLEQSVRTPRGHPHWENLSASLFA
jgi:hypothetical protein